MVCRVGKGALVEIGCCRFRCAPCPPAALCQSTVNSPPVGIPMTSTYRVVGPGGLLPSPLWGGVGGGGRRMWHSNAPRHDPPPQPSPTRGEGVGLGHAPTSSLLRPPVDQRLDLGQDPRDSIHLGLQPDDA